VVRDDPFGERMSSEDISRRARDTTKWSVIWRAGERASERAKEISCYETAPPSVIGRTYENSLPAF